jgi:lipoate-protein ligase A
MMMNAVVLVETRNLSKFIFPSLKSPSILEMRLSDSIKDEKGLALLVSENCGVENWNIGGAFSMVRKGNLSWSLISESPQMIDRANPE